MITAIRPQCACGSKLHAVDGGEAAPMFYRRTCRRCGRTWRIIVRPGVKLERDGIKIGVAHEVHLVPITAES